MTVTLGQTLYDVRFYYNDVEDGGWYVDFRDADNNPILLGQALTAGENVLQQFDYLGFPGEIWVSVNYDYNLEPDFNNIGSTGKVVFYVP